MLLKYARRYSGHEINGKYQHAGDEYVVYRGDCAEYRGEDTAKEFPKFVHDKIALFSVFKSLFFFRGPLFGPLGFEPGKRLFVLVVLCAGRLIPGAVFRVGLLERYAVLKAFDCPVVGLGHNRP